MAMDRFDKVHLSISYSLLPKKATEPEATFRVVQSKSLMSRHYVSTQSQNFLKVHVRLQRSVPVGLCFNGVATVSH